MTRARKLIRDRSGDLQIGVLVHEVFDTAWRDLEPALEAQPQSTVEGARVLLATTIVDRVKSGLVHPRILHDDAIGVVKSAYPQLSITATYLY